MGASLELLRGIVCSPRPQHYITSCPTLSKKLKVFVKTMHPATSELTSSERFITLDLLAYHASRV
jgi:hypothetical protein